MKNVTDASLRKDQKDISISKLAEEDIKDLPAKEFFKL